MEPRICVLGDFCSNLEIEVSNSTNDNWHDLQNIIYLAQRLGADLGYRFRWYSFGPYNDDLVTDFYRLEDSIARKESRPNVTLKEEAKDILTGLQLVTSCPPEGLNRAAWLKLLACLDFLKKVSQCQEDDIDKVLKRDMPNLVAFKSHAYKALNGLGLQS